MLIKNRELSAVRLQLLVWVAIHVFVIHVTYSKTNSRYFIIVLRDKLEKKMTYVNINLSLGNNKILIPQPYLRTKF